MGTKCTFGNGQILEIIGHAVFLQHFFNIGQVLMKSNPRGVPKLGDGWPEAAVKSFI
jgi:hypothetical protein